MKRLILVFAVASVLVVPSTAFAGGVVVSVERASQLVAVAGRQHRVALVHTAAAARLRVGQRVAFHARSLKNGTLAASSLKVTGRAKRVQFVGLVLARTSARYVLSAGGAVVTIRRGGPRKLASASDTGPTPGTTVQVSATVGSHGELEDDGVSVLAPTTPGGEIDGVLTLGAGTITVTAEHMSLVLRVPAGMDLSSFQNGQEVLAQFAQQTDGSLVLTTLSGNEDVQQANTQEARDDGSSDVQSGSGSPSVSTTGGSPATAGEDGGSGDRVSTGDSGSGGDSGSAGDSGSGDDGGDG